MKLIPVDPNNGQHVRLLYDLLAERPPEANISHRAMPLLTEHAAFVLSKPYHAWYILETGGVMVGSIYLTDRNEIGVAILQAHQRHGLARQAILMLVTIGPLPPISSVRHGAFLANINPANARSIKLFEGLGFQHIQNTYRL